MLLMGTLRKSQTDGLTGILHTLLEHLVTSEELDPLHFSSANNERSVSDNCFWENNNLVNWTYEKQSGDSFAKILKAKLFEESRGKSDICMNKKLKQLKNTVRVCSQSLLHANLGVLSQYCLKRPTT